MMTVHGRLAAASSHETACADFIGRGRTIADPAAMYRAHLGDSAGSVLDPIVAVRQTVVIEPNETVRVHIVTGVAATRDRALSLIEKHSDRHSSDRLFELAWTHSQVLLRRLDANDADAQVYEQSLAGERDVLESVVACSSERRDAQQPWPVWSLGLRHLRRPPHRVVARERRQQHRARATGREGAHVLALEGPRRGPRHLERGSLGLSPGVARSDPRADRITSRVTIWLDRPGGMFRCRARPDRRGGQGAAAERCPAIIVVDSDGSLADQVQRHPPALVKMPAFAGKMHPGPRPRAHPPPGRARPARPRRLEWSRWLHAGRPRIRHRHHPRAPHARAVGQRAGQPLLRHRGQRERRRLHLVRERPQLSPHALAQRSGRRSQTARRSTSRDEHDGHYWSPTPAARARQRHAYTSRHGFG